jgi:predicted metal-dependent hydrolase
MPSNTQPNLGFDYSVIYSDRRTVSITVERDGSVVVRVPRSTTREQLEHILTAKRRWIIEKITHPQKYKIRAHPPGKEIVSGESVMFLGHTYRIDLVDSDSREIKFDGRFLIPRYVDGRTSHALQEWFKQAAIERLTPRVEYWALKLGVDVSRVKVTDDRFRWGSCTPAGAVALNWRLVKAPIAVADYVIVHELAHRLEANHGDGFWSIVRSHIAKSDAARAWLKEHGQLLEEDF